MAGDIDELEATVARACASVGVELVDVEVTANALQVTVERSDGLDLDAVAEAARAISNALDEHDGLAPAERYELEVSSPGLERRLRRPDHFRRVLGSTISVRTNPGTDGPRRVEGTLDEVEDDAIVLSADGERHRVEFGDIERARTVFDWQAALREDRGAAADRDGTNRERKAKAKRARTGGART